MIERKSQAPPSRAKREKGGAPSISIIFLLPVQFHSELELAWVIGGGGLAGIAEQRTHSGHVHFVDDVEHVGDQVHAEAFREINTLRDAHIVEHGPGSHSGIAAQVAVELEKSWGRAKTRRAGQESENAGFLQLAGGRVLR